ncbi:MAG TPA: DEAD/DEAH box helicase family protein [Hanamia sp.]|nr:DEAD/DEAH box helicase family protein [Hanamia sp.]
MNIPSLTHPYENPLKHWELDKDGQPTQKIIQARRKAEFITPIPKARKQKKKKQGELDFGDDTGISTNTQKYEAIPVINRLRQEIDKWRKIPDKNNWGVTPETARLLDHWRNYKFNDIRPFFCQVEAVETIIWLTEVAPNSGRTGASLIEHLTDANKEANPELFRLALKLATGAGKTTVMAMIIAWQTINAVRRPQNKRFSRGFLIVAPGITIKDRLRVLQPNDPDSYYAERELVPADMMEDIQKAKIVITNYHAFKLKEKVGLSKGGRSLLQGRGEELNMLETEGQMIQRVMPELMGLKNIIAINDEALNLLLKLKSRRVLRRPYARAK